MNPPELTTEYPEIAAILERDRDLWVFAYGSLMWNPGVPVAETRTARLRGFHRCFRVASTRYRGTPERPGALLGLDRGGSCRGLALRLSPGDRREALDALWKREMTGRVYRPRLVPTTLVDDGTRVRALTFVIDGDGPGGDRELDITLLARRVLEASGERGSNLDYLLETRGSLEAMGIRDAAVTRLSREVERLRRGD